MDLQLVVDMSTADAMNHSWVEDFIVADAKKLEASDIPAFLWGERLAPFPLDLKAATMRRASLVIEGGA